MKTTSLCMVFLCCSSGMICGGADPELGWRENFAFQGAAEGALPANWKFEGAKFRVPKSEFGLMRSPRAEDGYSLAVTCPKSTGALLAKPKVDLKKYPILRWRWCVDSFPVGADGRQRSTDDQALTIYVGTGSVFGQRSIAYRFETMTPIGHEGQVKYAGGMMQVHYICLRNETSGKGIWFVEERDVAADFKRIYGRVPDEFVVSIGGNSQYTQSHCRAEVDYIELRTKKTGKKSAK